MVNNNPTPLHRGFFSALAIGLLLTTFAGGISAAGSAKSSLKPLQFKSFSHLQRVLATKTAKNNLWLYPPISDPRVLATPGISADSTGAIDHSTTNLQVEGVDEGDSVKTDGRFIYRIQQGKVQIVKSYPASELALKSELTFKNGFNPIELYVRDNQLIVVGTDWANTPANNPPPSQPRSDAPLYWWPTGEMRTVVKTYDITYRNNPIFQREVTFTGNFIASRRIGTNFYLVGRKYPNYFLTPLAENGAASKTGKQANARLSPRNILPRLSQRNRHSAKTRLLALSELYYFPGFVEPDYTIVASFKLDEIDREASIKAYLGGGDIAYASAKNLYLSAADYNPPAGSATSTTAPRTHLYKFSLGEGEIRFTRAGLVPGVPLNQFSMDEHAGYFRIATTVDEWTQTGDSGTLRTWNNLYTLDGEMNIAGRLEHLADGERLYSTRFIGDRGYLVTFKQVDPLFVVDLSIPSAPKVLGELKIPGFSNYLHPFDADHIIGFGQDTTENSDGGIVTSGLKLALFDVSDVSHPVQQHSLTIGQQGSYSPLLYDHKALLFNPKTGLLGFPLSITAKKAGEDWPQEVFQGAGVYHLSLTDGFSKLAQISHVVKNDPYSWYHNVQRLLTIEDSLYTISDTRIQANSLASFQLTGLLDFVVTPPPSPCGTVGDVADSASPSAIIDCPILIDPLPIQ
jgi:inhibitor of cysteine peptidase